MGIQPLIRNACQIDGWMSNTELNFLGKTASSVQTILEVGCYKGRSTRALADNCPGTVYAVDPWRGEYKYENGQTLFTMSDDHLDQFMENIRSCNNVVVCRGTLEAYLEHLPYMDFIFIDGDHKYEAVKKDISNSLKILKPGGILAGHDYGNENWPGVKTAVDELLVTTSLISSIWFKVI